jgi:EmrB/QacA subfamily drug resistance transporter
MLLGCCLALFIISLDATIVNVALPAIRSGLHASVTGLQWIVDAYTLVLASLLLLGGATGDRFGRRATFQAGLVVFAVASAGCSLAPGLDALMACRVLQAVGGAMMQPSALSTITSVITDPARRARAIGVWAGVFGVAAASGPILGGICVAALGWRSVFWVNLPVAAAAFVLVARHAPETRAPRPRRADLPGQALLVITLAAVTFATIEGPVHGWSSALITGGYALAACGLGAFVAVERHRHEPLLELRFFRSPPFSGAAAIATLAFAVLAGFLFLNTLYLQGARGYSALAAGVAMLPATAVIALVSPLTGRYVARRGSRFPLTAAGLFLAAGALVLGQDRAASPYPFLAAAYLLLGLGFALVNPPITNTAVSGMPREQAGVASAVATASRQLGNVLGVAVIGSVASSPAARGTAGFVAASHTGWDIAAACGLAIAAIGYLTTGPRAQVMAMRTASGRTDSARQARR